MVGTRNLTSWSCFSLALVLIVTGCMGRGVATMAYQLGSQNGHPALRLGDLTLVFEGQMTEGPPNQPAQRRGVLQVGGPGPKSSVGRVGDIGFVNDYKDGVATLTIAGTKFRVLDDGKRVEVARQYFDTRGTVRTVFIGRDGQVMSGA